MSLVFISSPTETFTPTRSGALATIMYQCCREAERDGVQPFVVVRRKDAEPYEWPNTIFVDYPRVPQSGPLWWMARLERKLLGWQHPGQRAFAHRMARAIAENNLQHLPMVVFNNPETAILLRRKFPQAFIAHWFQNQLECKPRVRSQLKNSVSAAWGVSNFTARWIEEYYGFEKNRVATVYNATDVEHFSPDESGANGGRSTSDASTSEVPTLNFVGRTGREKAPDLLLRAALQLAKDGKRFAIQIVGSNHWDGFTLDEYQQELKTLATQLQETGTEVRFTGHVARADLPGVLRQADINVTTSRWDEPFGMVTLEGMACGLATVASKTGGTPEVTGDAALLFERDDVAGLAHQLAQLIDNKNLRLEYSRRGRKRAEQFTWRHTWESLKKQLPLKT